jgi:hypothetical protein
VRRPKIHQKNYVDEDEYAQGRHFYFWCGSRCKKIVMETLENMKFRVHKIERIYDPVHEKYVQDTMAVLGRRDGQD